MSDVSDVSSKSINLDLGNTGELEPFLIIIVHGIGSNKDTQKLNLSNFEESFATIRKGGYYKQMYNLQMKMVDWKTAVDESSIRKDLNRCQIQSGAQDARDMFN